MATMSRADERLGSSGTTLIDRLRQEWLDDVGSWGADPSLAGNTFDDLVARYGEEHRRYHTLEHVAAVLRTAEGLVDGGDRQAVRMAAWYHDIVHDSHSHTNEARSAVLAAAQLAALGAPAPLVQECARLIEVTATHEVTDGDEAAAALVDADLAVLATGPDRYDRYRKAVRNEYAHLDDESFAAGRRRILVSLLERPYIFATATFRTEREPARPGQPAPRAEPAAPGPFGRAPS